MANRLAPLTLVACSLFAFAIGLAIGLSVRQAEAAHRCMASAAGDCTASQPTKESQ